MTQEISDISGNAGWDLVNIRKIFRLEDKRKQSFDNDMCLPF